MGHWTSNPTNFVLVQPFIVAAICLQLVSSALKKFWAAPLGEPPDLFHAIMVGGKGAFHDFFNR
ncbi:hypothetical protein [Desulfatibacillum aliphaticivorans]|uniref:hypothetical protein n=1 Tax=Desulfatibacillum aliphaticivorans TaxID=218208 RepID=UPI0004026F0E|nr:hypothetical protein [Desulfatibacillum aliphaticivorans]